MKIFLLWLGTAILATLFCADAWLGCYLEARWSGAVFCQGLLLFIGTMLCGGLAIEETLS